MADNTGIEWTDATWNPVTGCTKVSPGCDHCYAETFAERWRGTPGHYFEHGFDLRLRPERLTQPLRWKRPRRIFVNSMSDLFHDDIPDDYIAKVFAIMSGGNHIYQVLTKRHGRMKALLSDPAFRQLVFESRNTPYWTMPDSTWRDWPLPNVWLGVSVEDQKWADIRVPALLDTPAAIRWLSCEPLLGPLELRSHLAGHCPEHDFVGGFCTQRYHPGVQHIDWVVVGGESGSGARPMHPDWVRTIRDHCVLWHRPFFFKQWGEWAQAPSNYGPNVPEHARPHTQLLFSSSSDVDGQIMLRRGKKLAGRQLDGRTWDEYPAAVTS